MADESQWTVCGGFTIISTSVKNVNRPTGTVPWVALDVGRPRVNGEPLVRQGGFFS